MVLMDHCSNPPWHFWYRLILHLIENTLLFIIKPSITSLLFFEFYLLGIFTFSFIIFYNISSPLQQMVLYNSHIPFLVLITFPTLTLIQVGYFNLSIYNWIARTTFLWKLICHWAIFISFQWQLSLVLKSHSGPLKGFCILQNLLCWKIGFCFIIRSSFNSVNQIKWRTSFIL